MEARKVLNSMVLPFAQDSEVRESSTDSDMRYSDPSTIEDFNFATSCKIESHVKALLQEICLNSTFPTKYNLYSPIPGEPYIYAHTTITSPYKFSVEVFPSITKPKQEAIAKGSEEFTFHEVFESAIARYTGSNAKPNSVLRETRSTYFCYPVTITIEAVPVEKAGKPHRMLLLREFQILISIWEAYRNEMNNKNSSIDQLIGFAMPFEFCIVSSTDYDVPKKSFVNYTYFGVNGAPTEFLTNFRLPLTTSTAVDSTLSYLAAEKLGPSVSYLFDLMKSQSKAFSLSSALMIYDQLLCRLIVLHRYGVIHGDLNIDCLKFGSGNAHNVLYLNDFSASILLPIKSAPTFNFHDRFASSLKLKNKNYHFVHDLESAFYVFLLLAIGFLPWDNKVKSTRRSSEIMVGNQQAMDNNPMTDLSVTTKDKDAFWKSPNMVQRLLNSREFDISGSLYQNFTKDMLMSIYMKVRDTMTKCASISNEDFLTNISIHGTPANNAYFGIRKILASYFRFETMSSFLKDPATQAKVEMLKSHDPNDERVAWDLSSWCWNCISVEIRPTVTSIKSVHMQTSNRRTNGRTHCTEKVS